MVMCYMLSMFDLHDRTGRLENLPSEPLTAFILHDRTGRLETSRSVAS
ncbi:hypothetical protein E9M_07349 [Moraxella catarrhalis 46P47B1]|nr:hypothetical protein E9M_07349 [Moraxella catarrhalis 46P47B1]